MEDMGSAHSPTGGLPMDFTDEDWALVLDVARRTVLRIDRDEFLADDIAAQCVKKLFSRAPEIEQGKLAAYVKTMASNLYMDEMRRRQRARLDDRGLPEEVGDPGSAFSMAMISKSPSTMLIKSERNRRRAELARDIIESLPERQRRLIEMTVEGHSNDDIANELGYRNSATVSATRSRIYRRLEAEFQDQFSPSLFSTGWTGNL
jgi:RNA polymerase sigma factor (sigma-70 family)